MKKYYTLKELAKLLNLSQSALKRIITSDSSFPEKQEISIPSVGYDAKEIRIWLNKNMSKKNPKHNFPKRQIPLFSEHSDW